MLPGEGPGPGGGGGEASGSACVWLSGVLASATGDQLMEAFAQFSFPQKACVPAGGVLRAAGRVQHAAAGLPWRRPLP